MAEKFVFPRIPEANWWTLRSQFIKTVPTAVTPTYLMPLLGLTSEKAARNLIPPLRQLGLIDEDSKPTPKANDWRTDDKYEEVCRRMVEEVYPQELRDLFPGPEIDRARLAQWFMHKAELGQGAANANAAMYILLHSGLKQQAEDISKKKPNKNATPKVPAMKAKGGQSTVGIGSQYEPNAPSTVQAQPAAGGASLHIDLQIHISPEATLDQIDAIFASMAKHLYRNE